MGKLDEYVNDFSLMQFLKGFTIFPETGAVHSARYLMATEQLEIMDQSLAPHLYDEVGLALAVDFYNTWDKDEWLARTYSATYRGAEQEVAVDATVGTSVNHMQLFLRGLLRLHFTSSFGPVEAKYSPRQEALEGKFKSGFVATYGPGVPVSEAESLAASPSKGRWWHSPHMKLGYNTDRTWQHRYGFHPGVTLAQFAG